jgi:hypothetical protein
VPPAGGADPTVVSGASTWQGVAPVVERPTEVVAPVPPGAGAPPPPGPPMGGPPAGGPPPAPADSKSKGPMILAIIVVLALLGGGAFFLLGGDDDEGADDEQAQEDRDEDEDEEEEDDDESTTTTEAEETTTTTEVEETTTTTEVDEDPVDDQQFDRLTDDTGFLVVEVPVEWTDRVTTLNNGQPTIEASTSLASFRQDFSVPAVAYTVLSNAPVDFEAALAGSASLGNLNAACEPQPSEEYTDGVFTGRQQLFGNCGGIGTVLLLIAAANPNGVSVAVTIQLTSDDSPDIASGIVNTFNTTS